MSDDREIVLSPLIRYAPYVEGYVLDGMPEKYIYDVERSQGTNETFSLRYKPEPKGTIVVYHIWSYSETIQIEIRKRELYNNINKILVEAIKSDSWRLLNNHNIESIVIQEDGETQTIVFYYEPIPEWTINNNFHGYNIAATLFDMSNNDSLLDNDTPVYIKDTANFCYYKDNKVFICGKPANILVYGLYGRDDNYIDTMISISVRTTDNFGHFFSHNGLENIGYYEQIYSFLEYDKIKHVFKLDLSKPTREEQFSVLING